VLEIRRALKGLSIEGFDVILAHGEICTIAAHSVSGGVPVASVFHASAIREARYRRSLGLNIGEALRSRMIEPFLWAYERYSMRNARRVLVLSEFSRSLVIDTDREADGRLRVVGGGVDTAMFQPADDREELRRRLGIAPGETVLVTARRLVGRMGLEMLLHAFSSLHEGRGESRLVIIGDGELRGELEAASERLGLGSSVRFAGRLTDSLLRDWYCAADVFALPTLAYEGFGMVTTEALACGTPVVGTRVGATGEILARLDDRLLADQVNAGSFAAALERTLALSGPSFRQRCRAYATEHFAWDSTMDRWEAAVAELCPARERVPSA
jgi:glycosyltransferase involved in cell wall biosynthesis